MSMVHSTRLRAHANTRWSLLAFALVATAGCSDGSATANGSESATASGSESATAATGGDATSTGDQGDDPVTAGASSTGGSTSGSDAASSSGGDSTSNTTGGMLMGCPEALPSGWLMCDDFEASDETCIANANEDPCDAYDSVRAVNVSPAEANSGAKSLELVFRGNEQELGAYYNLPPGENHIFTRYYDYYAADFDFAAGMKVHRILGKTTPSLNNTYDSIAVAFGQPATPDSGDFCGTNDVEVWDFGANGDWGEAYFTPNPAPQRAQWHCWEFEFQVNTPGSSDGYFRVWMDGEQQAERQNLEMSAEITDYNRVLFGGWYSNGAAGQNTCVDPVVPSARYVDDVVVATERVGCL